MNAIRQTGVILARQMRPTLRNPTIVLSAASFPLLYLALFGPLLPALPGPLGGGDAWRWFVPGILVMVVMTAFFAGFSWLPEMRSGSHERLLTTPLPRGVLLLGRVLREAAVLAVQILLIIAVMIPFGLRLSVPGALLGVAILLVLGVGVAALSYGLAMIVREEYAFNGLVQVLFIPLLLLSGVFLPMDLAPAWLYTLSRANPFTHVVEAERALFAGAWSDPVVPLGGGIALAVAAAALWWGTRVMRRADP